MSVGNVSTRPAPPQGGLLARHPLVFYFLIAYAGAWLVWMPLVLSEEGVGLLPFSSSPVLAPALVSVGTFLGPTLSAFIMSGITEGRAGVRRLLRRIVLWRVGLRWYLFALIGIPSIMVLGMLVLPETLASIEPIDPLSLLTSYLPFFLIILLFGPLGEEPGWRGFALPRLQRLNGPLVGTFILWPLWVFWHLPLFWSGHWIPPSILNFIMFALAVLPSTVIVTWVFNNTKGSVLIAILMHAAYDAFPNSLLSVLFPVPIPILEDNDSLSLLPLVVGFGAVALVVVALTRGRLGYQHYQRDDEPDLATAPT